MKMKMNSRFDTNVLTKLIYPQYLGLGAQMKKKKNHDVNKILYHVFFYEIILLLHHSMNF